MELEQLRIFAAVAEAKSFSAAARALFVSHSTTSRAVAALEEELGVRLLERDNRVLRLTAAGEALREESRLLLEAERRALARVREAGERETEEIRRYDRST